MPARASASTAGAAGPPGQPGFLDGKSVNVNIVSLLGVGATVEIPMTWNRTLPNTSYSAVFLPDLALLGKFTFAVKPGVSKTATGCTIVATATTTVAIGLLGVVHVVATP